jgi:hypothetical protein
MISLRIDRRWSEVDGRYCFGTNIRCAHRSDRNSITFSINAPENNLQGTVLENKTDRTDLLVSGRSREVTRIGRPSATPNDSRMNAGPFVRLRHLTPLDSIVLRSVQSPRAIARHGKQQAVVGRKGQLRDGERVRLHFRLSPPLTRVPEHDRRMLRLAGLRQMSSNHHGPNKREHTLHAVAITLAA